LTDGWFEVRLGTAGSVLVNEAAEEADEYGTEPVILLWQLTMLSIGGDKGG